MAANDEQTKREPQAGCEECKRLEQELVEARERDRREKNLEARFEKHALHALKEHRGSHL
jgi:hypothetical protein